LDSNRALAPNPNPTLNLKPLTLTLTLLSCAYGSAQNTLPLRGPPHPLASRLRSCPRAPNTPNAPFSLSPLPFEQAHPEDYLNVLRWCAVYLASPVGFVAPP